ncbi:MAG: hypothetical protein ACOZNI_07145 [Myxococcota bacterium]
MIWLLLIAGCPWVDESTHAASFDRDGDGVSWPDDCDDEDPVRAPDNVEVCGDGVENDCEDGAPDCGLAGEIDPAALPLRYDGATSSRFGWSVAAGDDVDGDGVEDVLVGAPGEEGDAGRIHVLFGPVDDPDDLETTAGDLSDPTGEDYLGYAVALPGDLDGDGAGDLAFGSPSHDVGGEDSGRVDFYMGPMERVPDPRADTWWFAFSEPGALAGYRVTGGGDVDGDGLPDVVTGMPGYAAAATYGGGAAVSAWDPDRGQVTIGAPIRGTVEDQGLGTGVAILRDYDGDGISDVAVGGGGAVSTGQASAGVLLLFLGPLEGDQESEDADVSIPGDRAGDHLGTAVAAVGDTDGDGLDDLIVGAVGAGRAWVLGAGARDDLGEAIVRADGPEGEATGEEVFAAGDMDADGVPDAVVSAMEMGVSKAWILPGSARGTVDLDTGATRMAGTRGAYFGRGASPAGDLDGDGAPDLLVGAPFDASTGVVTGAVYLVPGAPGL